jgi:WD40 repeat protein
MSYLRKALGERASDHRFIVTVPGRGYRFVAELLDAGRRPEMIIESRTASEIVIEEEIVSDSEAERAIDGKWTAVPQLKSADSTGVVKTPGVSTSLQRTEAAASPFKSWLLIALAGASAGFLLVAVIGFIWFYQWWNRNRQTVATTSPSQLTLRRFATHGGIPFYVAISPDGKTLAYIQRLKGKYSLWVGQIETSSSLPIYEQPGISLVSPTFSPDGSSIYFIVGGENRPQATLARLPVLGGALTELIPNVDSSITFSPDGKQLAFLRRASGQTSLIVADAADGKNERVLTTRKSPENFSSRDCPGLLKGHQSLLARRWRRAETN